MRFIIAILFVIVVLGGCTNTQNNKIMAGSSAVELRSYQSRAFDMTDQDMLLRTIIATMQDLGFVINKAAPMALRSLAPEANPCTRVHTGKH